MTGKECSLANVLMIVLNVSTLSSGISVLTLEYGNVVKTNCTGDISSCIAVRLSFTLDVSHLEISLAQVTSINDFFA